ncbi:uncharacterized protein G2W53_023489 [Senna tora]|uniref:Uncharacterized protein n=1 Tax=Senna tora TaxID=362788 RepID=A0A834TAD4_9FABA|nr:uncharacterized protein G2W53_023489 [Senna tora]
MDADDGERLAELQKTNAAKLRAKRTHAQSRQSREARPRYTLERDK